MMTPIKLSAILRQEIARLKSDETFRLEVFGSAYHYWTCMQRSIERARLHADVASCAGDTAELMKICQQVGGRLDRLGLNDNREWHGLDWTMDLEAFMHVARLSRLT